MRTQAEKDLIRANFTKKLEDYDKLVEEVKTHLKKEANEVVSSVLSTYVEGNSNFIHALEPSKWTDELLSERSLDTEILTMTGTLFLEELSNLQAIAKILRMRNARNQ